MIVDKHLAVNTTKYPLAQSSLGQIKGVIFPYKDITSLVIQSPVFQYYHIKSIVLLKEYIQISIASNSSSDQFYFNVGENTTHAFILSKQTKALSGHATYIDNFYNDLLAFIKALGTQLILDIDQQNLKLSLHCVNLFKYTNPQSITINNITCAKHTQLYMTNNTEIQVDSVSQNQQFNLFGDCPLNQINFYPYSIKNLKITKRRYDKTGEAIDSTNTIPMSDQRYKLIIKPRALSDLRVLTYKDSIKFTGAIDA